MSYKITAPPSDSLAYNLKQLIRNNVFSLKLIGSIPGLFFVYKKCGEEYQLYYCNETHLTITGYSAEESLGNTPFFFTAPASHNSIKKGLENITVNQLVQGVYGDILCKNGQRIPFVFEGYGFENQGDRYFMGTGIDLSNLAEAQAETQRERIKREEKEKELLSLALKDSQKDQMLQSISKKLDQLQKESNNQVISQKINQLSQEINSFHIRSKDQWGTFELLFNNINPNFIKTLSNKDPNTTTSELQYCSFIRINMSSGQICNALNITKEGLKKKKYRLRQKLTVPKGVSLESYIRSL